MTGGSVTKDTLPFATTQHEVPPKPASVHTKHLVQAAQVEDGNVEEAWFSKGYLRAGGDNINTSITTLVHHVEQCRNGTTIRDNLLPDVQSAPKNEHLDPIDRF